MTTKRIYGAKTKRRTYTVTDEVIKSLGDIGNGNRSKGLRICSGYHGRLVEALHYMIDEALDDYFEASDPDGEIAKARTLLASLEAEKGGEL